MSKKPRQMAEEMRFELTIRFTTYDGLANRQANAIQHQANPQKIRWLEAIKSVFLLETLRNSAHTIRTTKNTLLAHAPQSNTKPTHTNASGAIT